MYLPLMIYHSLNNQQGSRWIFQASQMNGNLYFFTLQPDQILVIGAIFLLILLPIFKKIIFPYFENFGLNTPLRKIGIGMVIAVITFLYSAYLEYCIQNNYITVLW